MPLTCFSSPTEISWQDPRDSSCDWLHCAFRMSRHVKSLNMTKTQLLKKEPCLSKFYTHISTLDSLSPTFLAKTSTTFRFVYTLVEKRHCTRSKLHVQCREVCAFCVRCPNSVCVKIEADDVHIVVTIRGDVLQLVRLRGCVFQSILMSRQPAWLAVAAREGDHSTGQEKQGVREVRVFRGKDRGERDIYCDFSFCFEDMVYGRVARWCSG